MPHTVVHRSQLKSRPSLISIDKGVGVVEIMPDASPSTSAETSGNSGKSSGPEIHNNSTGKTSQDSKFSLLAKKASGLSQHSSENKKTVIKQLAAEGSVETPLKPIQEVEVVEIVPEPVPSEFYLMIDSLCFGQNKS
jgi:protein-serine/threonine kinase